ncbi:hypothetical protein L1987_84485 [Smallanthus sonchifolius]|uniref:Uncharacterized protein n=1 Tax=Smallanthus sonchifolius TaxID=185202 RepID=A0ACB8YFS6_9ASTR|nr:hypothetical protein L1987_84485 [Smallanthus sonchifolius]
MINERWVAAAITSDALVAELLLRLKRSSSFDSTPPLNPPPVWGDRKSRSKASTVGKGQQQRSPSSPLSWSGGGDPSTSDGYDECVRPSDLYSGNKSIKIDLDEQPRKECGIGSEVEMMKRRRCMLPDLNETPAYE